MDFIWTLMVAYGGRVLLSIVFLLVGLRVIKKFSDLFAKKMDSKHVDPSLRTFIVPMVKASLQVLLVIAVASMLGAEMTSFIAIIGAVGFAVGLALQGSLSNFAGGVLILLLKPFKVGDFIQAGGFSGTVREIQIFYTVMSTPDNRKIIIPNANLSNSSAVNFSAYTTRRVDFKFGVGYQADIQKVKSILSQIAMDHPLIHDDPAPMIVLSEHGDSALVFSMRVWCEATNYWSIYFDIMEKVKMAFDENDINIPYPQMDVHLSKE